MAENDNREVEIKIKLDDKPGFIKKLGGLGAKKTDEGMYRDVYYDGEHLDQKTLRVRSGPNKSVLTYKERPQNPDAHILDRVEIQTDLSSPKAMDAILRKLGFKEKNVKEKKYENYEFEGAVVEFHNLPFLGDFLEIEASQEKIQELLPKLGLSLKQGINISYNQLFEKYAAESGLPAGTNDTYADAQKYK